MPEENTTTSTEEQDNDTVECRECHDRVPADESVLDCNDETWCQSCHDDNHTTCASCDEMVLNNTVSEVQNGDMVCYSCISSRYFTCSDCDGIARRDDGVSMSPGTRICNSCFEDNCFTCRSCDSIFNNDDYGEDGRCRGCCDDDDDESSDIHDYGFTIPTRFIGQGPHYYGVELEVECVDTGVASGCLDLLNRSATFAYAKHDGSLSNGFEIVTVPASLDKHLELWADFFKRLPSGIKSFDTKTCGLHVHCSRKPLSTLTVGKIVVFVNKRENQSFVERIAGRPTGQWAEYKNKKHKDAMPGMNMVRYEAVNLLNYETIEFRIFKGTLKKASVFKAIEFCDALIRFCLPCKQSIEDSSRLDRFIDYVKDNKKQYPHLWGFISAKWLGLECKESEACGYSVNKGEQ